LCLAVSACGIRESDFPESAVYFIPPAEWRAWWEVLESCSGRRGDFDSVRWFRVLSGEINVRGETAFAAWYERGNRIALTSETERGELVRHEMLHALLQGGSHPAEYFAVRCGDLVLCGRDCPSPVVPDNAMPIALSDVDVDLEVFPKTPSLSRHGGSLTFVLRVTNKTGRNAFLDLRHVQGRHCGAGVMIMSARDPNRFATKCSYIGFGGLPRLFVGDETRSVVLDMRLQHTEPGQGPFFAEPLIFAAVLGDNVRRIVHLDVRP
jgi:hypothetical protein